jgi:transposase
VLAGVNAAHLKHVPGRKTDVRDCAWIAQVLEHGRVRGSFVSPAPIRELRALTRYRKSVIRKVRSLSARTGRHLLCHSSHGTSNSFSTAVGTALQS